MYNAYVYLSADNIYIYILLINNYIMIVNLNCCECEEYYNYD